MKNIKRAIRRHHRQRLIDKVARYRAAVWRDNPKEFARIYYNNVQVCSCYTCGNQRKIEGDSIQERRAKF